MSYAAIAERLGMSHGAVYWHCLRLGADSPKSQEHAPPVERGPMIVCRSGHQVRRFTADEDRKLIEMEAAGLTASEMARRLNRKPNSVTGRLMTLARTEARKEATA
ncbi:hypothetical protein [Pseudophaeobacter sp. C1-32P7]|uniref:hypothetical protein n=1 Tax=Pseudophaeobacter sp. C1-32P7 TaxID=3098142 RepID=UPI0034D7455F